MRIRSLAAILLIAAGCASAPPATPPAPAAAAAAPVRDQQCIDDCIYRNQMKAISIQKIESDCEAECSAGADQPR